jgi:uncharacterized protein involved in outer membrane biogenesis
MNFLQQPIEKKLSNLLGAMVTFERMKFSPLAGRLAAEGVIVAGDTPDRPLVTIRGIDAQISVAKALTGQIVIKSLMIEGADIFLVRREDGSLNIPKRPPKSASDPDEESAAWQFEAQSIRIKDGRIRFLHADSRVAKVEGINAELKCKEGKIDLAAIELLVNAEMKITFPLDAIFPQRKT